MNYYYYPLCSKDFTFENIFSSESVSPAKVYELRGFGANFSFTIPLFHHPEMIVLYNKPPKYAIEDPSYEALKFVLKVRVDAIASERLILISEGIVGYPGTIYLNKENFELLFFSEKELTITSLRSEASLLTKSYKKYRSNFKIINESDCSDFDTSMIPQTSASELEIQETVVFDRKYNSFKGFCYGLASGIMRSQSNKESVLKRTLQDVTNSFAEFKNRVDNSSKTMYNKYNSKQPGLTNNKELTSKVFSSIQSAEYSFKEALSGESYSEKELEKYVHRELEKQHFSTEEIQQFLKFKKMEDLLLGTNTLLKIKNSYLKSNDKNPILLFEVLRESLLSYSNNGHANTDWAKTYRERSNDSFKQVIYELSRIADMQAAKNSSTIKLDFSTISYNFPTNEVYLEPTFQELDKGVHNEYLTALNVILQKVKNGKGEAKKEDILSIVETTASNLNKSIPGKGTNLYQYLSGEINEYDANKVHSIVMKNFVAFVFNPDSLEKLENYLNAKDIEFKWIAYSFWCCFNGFTNISGNFVSSLFNGSNDKASRYLDYFIMECFTNGNALHEKRVDANSGETSEVETSTPQIEKVNIFFDRYINGKYKISLEQLQSVVNLHDRDKMIDELKSKHRIAKKDAGKLIDHFENILKGLSLFQ